MQIPNHELREQALQSLKYKAFHCEGASVYSHISQNPEPYLQFIVAYQTLCDYLDTLCDRSTSADLTDYRTLHQSLLDCFTPGAKHNYYQKHADKEDGGYMEFLVEHCQKSLATLPIMNEQRAQLIHFCSLYIDLQVYKHGPQESRIPHLKAWHKDHITLAHNLPWWEFSAASGSTLALFAILATPDEADLLMQAYFPWFCALHIQLDYFIDRQEDQTYGDLNFVAQYAQEDEVAARLLFFLKQLEKKLEYSKHATFHKSVARGMIGFYLSDVKYKHGQVTYRLLRAGGPFSRLIYLLGHFMRQPSAPKENLASSIP